MLEDYFNIFKIVYITLDSKKHVCNMTRIFSPQRITSDGPFYLSEVETEGENGKCP